MGERTGTLAPLIYYRMDVHTLSTFLSPILTVASVWNTGETIDMNNQPSLYPTTNLNQSFWIQLNKLNSYPDSTIFTLKTMGESFSLNRIGLKVSLKLYSFNVIIDLCFVNSFK